MQILSFINSLLSGFFGLIISPFANINPFWSLALFSLILAILMLFIFKYTSNQKKIKKTKNKIRAHIYELSLFKDELGIVLSAQKNILIQNLNYIKYALIPMIFMIIPIAIILIQLDSWYGHRPLSAEESTIVSLTISENREIPETIGIESDKGLSIETPALRIPEQNQVDWRVRAIETGEHNLVLNVSGQEFQKKVIVGDKSLIQISPYVSTPGFWNVLLNPAQTPITKGSIVEKISVDYDRNSIDVYKWQLDWIIIILVLSIVFAFGLKGLFRIEI